MKMYRYLKPAIVTAALAVALPAAAQTGFRYDDDTAATTATCAMTSRAWLRLMRS